MSQLIEAMARGIQSVALGSNDWRDYIKDANAALAAMREGPAFDEMYDHGLRGFVDHPENHGAFRAGLRAALTVQP